MPRAGLAEVLASAARFHVGVEGTFRFAWRAIISPPARYCGAMSHENVEIVRAATDAYNRGDIDAAFKDVIPDFEYDQTRAVGMDRGVFSLDEFRDLLAEFASSWESFTIGADEFIDCGEQVVMPFTNVARGRDGIEVQARGVWVWTIRDGSIVRACLYQELQEALEAAGLSE